MKIGVYFACSAHALLVAAALFPACALQPEPGPAPEEPESDLPAGLLDGHADFVSVGKASTRALAAELEAMGSSPGDVGEGQDDFFLAIRRDVLDERWFLSAYMKQLHPGNAGAGAALTLGTRVVSFRVQNGKLFVFDTSDQFKASEISDPEIVLEAYPIVELEAFHRLRGSDDYVLVDPSAGLNRFLVTGELYIDPYLADFGAFPVTVGLSFMQNFRAIPDGVTFEQVFAGEAAFSLGASATVWGTLGVSVRRYQVGEGYLPTPDPGIPHYFLSDSRFVPGTDAYFLTEANPVRWNLFPGRTPIQVAITAGARRAQAAFPDFDILGAFERGIEDWNQVLGYQAFDAVFVDDDRVRDNDESTVLVDYPGIGIGFSFADWRHNPNNGEILGGSVYFDSAFFDVMASFEDDPVAASAPPTRAEPGPVYSLLWGGMPARRPACAYRPLQPGDPELDLVRGDGSLTGPEKGTRYIENAVTHEWGHVLGLRHNFKGSLVPPSSSVMEYSIRADRTQLDDPGAYDIDAIRYLYQISPDLPAQPFCTEESLGFDPDCVPLDSGADPLHEYWPAVHADLVSQVLDGGGPPFLIVDESFLAILGYARDSSGFMDPADRLFAADLLLGRVKVPLDPADAADPLVVERASELAAFLFENMGSDFTDPGVIAFFVDQAGRMALNEDGARIFELRRTAVDFLRGLQDDGAFLELRAVRDAIAGALAAGTVPADEVPFTEDLLARIEAALSPYYD